MQTEKNKWVDDVLSSADIISRAPSPDMTMRMMSRTVSTRVNSPVIWRIAASVALLIALNISTLYLYNGHHSNEHHGHSQDAASLFGLGSGDNNQADLGTVFFGN
ncbi:MAG: hypothetical protein JWO03_2433 [Bacteroidetes bacterium]|nr:hypothetical protein [Bacteroidota bacterium]